MLDITPVFALQERKAWPYANFVENGIKFRRRWLGLDLNAEVVTDITMVLSLIISAVLYAVAGTTVFGLVFYAMDMSCVVLQIMTAYDGFLLVIATRFDCSSMWLPRVEVSC